MPLKDEAESITESRLITGSITVTENMNTADIILQLQNYFKADRNVQPMIVYYDKYNKMISCNVIEPEKIGADTSSRNYNAEIPDNAATIKVFAWNSISEMRPYTISEEISVNNN